MSRVEKIAHAIKKEVSVIIHGELNDPRLGFVTITEVKMSPDLRVAKVSFSVLGNEEEYKKTKEALDSSVGFIRRLVAQRIKLRFAPEFIFKADKSIEYSVRIEKILNEIKEKDEPKKDNRDTEEEK